MAEGIGESSITSLVIHLKIILFHYIKVVIGNMRHEKFSRLTYLRKSIAETDVSKFPGIENLQYLNVEIISVKPQWSNWVTHVCKHNELLREMQDEGESCSVRIHKTVTLKDCTLWLGVCPVCHKYIIGVQKRENNSRDAAPNFVEVASGLTMHDANLKAAEYSSKGYRVKKVVKPFGYSVFASIV